MPKKKQLNLSFPLAGLNRRASLVQSPPYATNDCLNVRPFGPISGRERGGSRPGLILSHIDDLGSNVNMLCGMNLAISDSFTNFSDTFPGLSIAAAWTAATWLDTPALPNVLNAFAQVDTDLSEAAAVLDALDIDTSQSYTVEIFLTPHAGSFHGDYRLYFRLDDTTPDIDTDGVVVELTATGATNSYTCSLHSYLSESENYTFSDVINVTTNACAPAWLSCVVNANTVSVYWNGSLLFDTKTIDAHSGSRVGFGMECTNDDGICLVNVFRVQYYSTSDTSSRRTVLVAAGSGSIYRETTYGRMTVSTDTPTVNSSVYLQCCQSGQLLYIADYGDIKASGTDGVVSTTSLDSATYTDWTAVGIDIEEDVVEVYNGTGTVTDGTYQITNVAAGNLTLDTNIGSGTCAFRIWRAPKIYDPVNDTTEIMYAEDADVPTGCPLICRYMDRIVLAGHSTTPNAWYMSRVSAPLDWDFSQTDDERAMVGTSSQAGVPGEPITALVPHSDDYLVIGCRNSLWRLRGDPAFGGSLDALSHTIGIVSAKSWCLGPNGELVFLSPDGIYILNAGGDSYPQSISRESLPQEFLNVNPLNATVLMEYDINGRGIHVYLTQDSSNEQIHWWLDWEKKSFWPMSMDEDYEPLAICAYQSQTIEDSGVILGCRDGYLRKYNNYAETDCSTEFESYVLYGPIPLSADGFKGQIESLDVVLATYSGDIEWDIMPSNTYEGSLTADASDSGTWEEGLNSTSWIACAGQAFCLKLTGEGGRRWEIESISAIVKTAGKRRIY